MRLFVVRHGETEWNAHKMTQGMNNTSLSRVGARQAVCLSRRLEKMREARVISSPLSRAYDTACTIAYENDWQLDLDDDLREIRFGHWEGLTFEQIKQRFPQSFDEWADDPLSCSIPGESEPVSDVMHRVNRFVSRLLEQYGEQETIIAVSHSVPCKIMIAQAIGLPIKNMHSIRLDNASISIIEYYESRPVLRVMNDTSHLREGGLCQER